MTSRFPVGKPFTGFCSFAFVTLLLPCESAPLAAEADFYLSPDEAGGWSGTLAEPCAAGTDNPFTALEHARDAVRVLRKEKRAEARVLIRGGDYRLKDTVVFAMQDSDRKRPPLVIVLCG